MSGTRARDFPPEVRMRLQSTLADNEDTYEFIAGLCALADAVFTTDGVEGITPNYVAFVVMHTEKQATFEVSISKPAPGALTPHEKNEHLERQLRELREAASAYLYAHDRLHRAERAGDDTLALVNALAAARVTLRRVLEREGGDA